MTRTPQPKHLAPPRTLRRLSDVAGEIKDADQLLFRRAPNGHSAISRLITVGGRSIYRHAAKAIWWRAENAANDLLMCVEVRERVGGRAVTLASQVEQYPGLIDVYRTNPHDLCPEYDRDGAAAHMMRLAGTPYGYMAVWNAALLHMPPFCLLMRPDMDDESRDGLPLFCSAACAEADRLGGGVDDVPHLADRMTEPGDLARSLFYRYQWTLIPDGQETTQMEASQ